MAKVSNKKKKKSNKKILRKNSISSNKKNVKVDTEIPDPSKKFSILKKNKPIKNDLESPRLYIGFMIGFMVAGLLYLVISYISNGALFHLGNWNLPIGFGLLITGFSMTTKWK